MRSGMLNQILTMRANFSGTKLFTVAAKKFVQDDCFTLSLSISFVFLMSIIPFATLSILVFDMIQRLFISQVNWTGQITEMLADEMIQVIPFVSRQWIKAHVINAQAYASFKAINFIMLPVISGLIFKTLETSFRKIFQLPVRHLLFGQAIYVSMSIFAVLLFFISNFTWIILSTSASQILTIVNKTPYLEKLYNLVVACTRSGPLNGLSLLVLMTFYLTTVRLFLNLKIKWRYQLSSGLAFCLLWIVARHFFGFYVRHISEIDLLYGSLSSVVLILMWIFYSAIALLFSIEILYLLHDGKWRYRWW